MRELKTITKSYDMGLEWRMDIINDPVEHYAEAWMYQETYGIKMLMFGCNYNTETCGSFSLFKTYAVTNYEDYKEIYMEEFPE